MTYRRTLRKSWERIALILVSALSLSLLLADTDPASAAPRAPSGFLGVVPQTDISAADSARMKRGKIKNLRIAVSWGQIQPDSPGTFNWAHVDATFRAAARNRVRIMPTLYGVPPWMNRKWTRMPVGNANQLKRWRQFVRAAVVRYGHGGRFWAEERSAGSGLPAMPVRDWQIWNEPNFHHFSTPVSPARYAKLVRASSRAIKAVNRNARVVIGGLFGRPKGPPARARHASTFLKQFRRKINRRAYDVIAIHPYAPGKKDLRWIMRNFRTTAKRAGLGGKPIYITEMGWASGRRTNAFMAGSKKAQAKKLRSAFAYLIRDRKRLKLRQVYWYSWKDGNPKHPSCNFCGTIGLFSWHPDKLIAKPAWRAFVRFTGGRP